jgi:hypothetical protein
MASFKSYGATVNVNDPYAEGSVINAKEAAALNTLRGELISHRVRASVFGDLTKGQTASDEQAAAAQAKADEISRTFEFGGQRVAGEPRVVDPVEKEARAIARHEMLAKLAGAGLKLGKKATAEAPEESGDKIYSAARFAEKVAELAARPAFIAKAKTIVKARSAGKGDEVEVEL